MKKIGIHINDVSVIDTLLKDEEFAISVKDAICEGIARKAIKLVNVSDDMKKLRENLGYAIRKEFEDKLFTGNVWDLHFQRQYAQEIRYAVEEAFDNVLRKAINDKAKELFCNVTDVLKKEVEAYKSNAEDWMERFDAESIFREECWKFMQSKFNSK